MASSETEIANLALAHLGHGVEIGSLRTTRSPQALALRLIYDTIRRATLRDFAWPFAHKIGALGLVTTYGTDDDHPTAEWKYAYRLPSDCVQFRKIQSGTRNDTLQSKVKYKISRDDTGWLIFTDMEDAIGEWTIDTEEVEKYPDDFVLALSLRLAAYAAPKICREDPFGMRDKAFSMYQREIAMAQNNGFNEESREEDPASELERART